MRNRPCLDCAEMLVDAIDVPSAPGSVQCACGLIYAIKLLDDADPELWERARAERLYVRDGNTAWMTTPIEAIRDDPRWVAPHSSTRTAMRQARARLDTDL